MQKKAEESWLCGLPALLPNAPGGVRLFAEVPSTNQLAKQSALEGVPHGSLFAAARQTAGRGRGQHTFASPPGGVYFSTVLRPAADAVSILQPGLVTAGAAVAACRAAAEVCGRQFTIKWVNDLLWRGKKCGGILAEAVWQNNVPAFFVVGIGINVTTPAGMLPPEAVPLYTQPPEGPPPHARLVAAAYTGLLALWNRLPDIAFMNEYRSRSAVLGRRVEVLAQPPYFATAVAVDDAARLLVQTSGGEGHTLSSGEISVRL